MFENMNNPQNSKRPAVDDIFAETDKPGEQPGAAAGPEISPRKVGLSAGLDNSAQTPFEEGKPAGKGFKLAVAGMVLVIVGLLGFLGYSKFFSNNKQDVASVNSVATITPVKTTNSTGKATSSQETPAFTDQIPAAIENATTTATGTAAAIEQASTSTLGQATSTALLDSDNDGLPDQEEATLKTNSNLVDTDGDGLSDYEEVRIYKTNPLVADTDSDGYSDSEEVKNGYNPNGSGKMPGITAN